MNIFTMVAVVAAAFLSSPASALETLPTIAEAPVTTYGKTLFSEEINHGSQVAITMAFSANLTTDTTGRNVVLNSLMGSPGKFVLNDLATGEQLKVLPLGKNSAGSYATLTHSSGDVYLSSHPHGRLYQYKPGADELIDHGPCDPGVKFIWEMEEISDGKIILACYPKSLVVEFDPATGKFRNRGSARDGDDYARAVAWHPPTNRLFVGVGSKPALISWDLKTGEKTNILPEITTADATVYSVDMVGDMIVTRLSPSIKGMVFNANTLELHDTVKSMGGSIVSPLAPDGASYFFTNGSDLIRHNLKTKTKEVFGKVSGNTRYIGFPANGESSSVVSISYNGIIDRYKLADRERQTIKQTLPSEPIDIHSLFAGPDGRIYTSGYVAGSLGIFDPKTSKSEQLENEIPQTEDATFAGNLMYLGTYPKARIVRYEIDPSKHVNVRKDENPKEIMKLESYGQDRPYAMLGLPDTRQCAIGTIPGYGKLGGVVALYNEDDKTSSVYPEILGKRGAVSMAEKNGILYVGTTISGGLGMEPSEKEAVLIGMDLKTGEKLFEMVPLPGMRIIGDLKLMPDGKIWGWAEATFFIFNPETRKVEKTAEVKKLPAGTGHMWRSSHFTNLTDNGKLYALAGGQVLEMDVATGRMEKVADATGFSLIVLNKDSGSLFFSRKHELFEWKRRP